MTQSSTVERRSPFNRFWAGYTVSQAGDRLTELALPLIAVTLLGGSAAQTSVVVALVWLPNVVSPLLGVWVDGLRSKRRIMILADLLRAATLLVLPVTYLTGTLSMGLLYGVALLTGLGQTVFDVTYPSFFAALVPRHDYVSANARLNATRSASSAVGPALGGLLIQALTAPVAVAFDAVSFLFSAGVLARLRTSEPEPGHESSRGVLHRLGSGLRFIARQPVIRASLACSTTMNVFMFVAQALVILYASRELGLSAATIGIAIGVGSVGGLAGAVLANRLAGRVGLGWTTVVGAFLYPAPVALLALASGPHWVSAAILALSEMLSGVGVMLFDITNNSLKTASTPDGLRSRTAGAYNAVNYGIRPVGALLGGWLGATIGLRPTLLVAAVGGALGCVWLLASPLARLRTVDDAAAFLVDHPSQPAPGDAA